MKYLCWDIDGTLLLTNNAGLDALNLTIRERFGKDYRFAHSLAGTTDSSIVKEVVTALKGRCSSADAAGFLITYARLLKQQLPTHRGRLMPYVLETLSYIRDRVPEWQNCLLTGNTREAAIAKIQYYRLAPYVDFNRSVYGDLSEDRQELARILYARLLGEQSITSPGDLVVIGDTVHDASCAAAIGAPCLIVLAGSSARREDFAALQPWKIIDALPADPADFVRLVNSAVVKA